MNFEHLIKDFAHSHGFSPAFDERGICHFLINDTFAVSLEKSPDQKGFFLYAVLAHLPPDQKAEYAIAALDGNLFGKEMDGSSIGYDSHTNNLILFRYFDGMHTEKIDFETGFTAFVQVFAHWTNKLKSLSR